MNLAKLSPIARECCSHLLWHSGYIGFVWIFLLEYIFLKYPPLDIVLTEFTSIFQKILKKATFIHENILSIIHQRSIISISELRRKMGKSTFVFRIISFSPWSITLHLSQELKYEMCLFHLSNSRTSLLNFTFLSKADLEKNQFST